VCSDLHRSGMFDKSQSSQTYHYDVDQNTHSIVIIYCVCSDLHRSGMFNYFETLYTVCVLIYIVVVCLTTLRLYILCSDLHRSGMFDYFETLYTVCVLIYIVVVS
jgi:hypothetical protein